MNKQNRLARALRKAKANRLERWNGVPQNRTKFGLGLWPLSKAARQQAAENARRLGLGVQTGREL